MVSFSVHVGSPADGLAKERESGVGSDLKRDNVYTCDRRFLPAVRQGGFRVAVGGLRASFVSFSFSRSLLCQ